MAAIVYDEMERCFVFLMRESFYALRVLSDGSVVYSGSGPMHLDTTREVMLASGSTLSGLEQYDEQNFAFEQQARTWELPTFGDVTYHDVAVKLSFNSLAKPLSPCESAHLPVRDLRLRYVGHEIRTDEEPGFAPPHKSESRGGRRETLCVHLRDQSYDFGATLFYRITPEHDIIERWLELVNNCETDVTVESLSFGTVHVPNGRYEVTHAAGAFTREFLPVRNEVAQGRTIIESQSINTGNMSNPAFLLNEVGRAAEDSGHVFFGALAYSGNWSLRFEGLSSSALRIHGGYQPIDFSMTLKPGESHRTPAFVHGCCQDGWGGASRRLHRFAKDYVLPDDRHGNIRPVLYNSWEAVYFDMTSDLQIELARKAAEIGVELFCVDDGWFGGRRDDKTGLGDWFVSPVAFPNGLNPLIDEVKRLGMRFGLWVEPEMVNVNSDLYRAHPDWVLHFPGRPRTEMRNQLMLDFGRPEVVEYIYGLLDTLMRYHDITFFKWDMNRYATEPGSVVGKMIWLKHIEGVYSIMDRLRAAYTKLEIQSCSGGGSRIDLGIMERTEQVWVSDNTDAYDRTVIQDGFSLYYPPKTMESWVTHEHNHQTGRHATLDLRFDVAMRGALGIGSSLNELSLDELNDYRRKISFYKQIRPITQNGDLYRLSSDPGTSIWLSVSPDKNQAVYSAVVTTQLQGFFRAAARLPGLRPEAAYEATNEHGYVIGRLSGFQLATLGIPGDTSNGGAQSAARSRTLLLQSV
jgi:alpha-galactosidase